MDRASIKEEAKTKIAPIRRSYIGIALILLATAALVSFAAQATGSDSAANGIASLYNLFVAPLLTIATLFFAVQAWRNNSPTVGDWLNASFDRYGRKLGGYLWMNLKVILWALPFAAAIALYAYFGGMDNVFYTMPGEGRYLIQNIGNAPFFQYRSSVYIDIAELGNYWLIFVIYLAMTITLAVVTLAYTFTTYILAACPNVKARDAVKLSAQMTKGYKGQIFVMGLSFIGWILLSVLTVGILYLVYVGPYMSLSYAGMFDEIKRENIESGRMTAADFGEDAPAKEENA